MQNSRCSMLVCGALYITGCECYTYRQGMGILPNDVQSKHKYPCKSRCPDITLFEDSAVKRLKVFPFFTNTLSLNYHRGSRVTRWQQRQLFLPWAWQPTAQSQKTRAGSLVKGYLWMGPSAYSMAASRSKVVVITLGVFQRSHIILSSTKNSDSSTCRRTTTGLLWLISWTKPLSTRLWLCVLAKRRRPPTPYRGHQSQDSSTLRSMAIMLECTSWWRPLSWVLSE